MSDPEPAARTHARALDMLSRAPRSVADLRRRLQRKGEPPEEIESVILRLTRAGLLDDATYARMLARSKLASQGFSRRRLLMELARRGVEREVASAAVDEVLHDDAVDERANIERAARKKLRTMGNLDDATRERRLLSYLARRGYELDDVRQVARQLLREDAPG